MDAFYASVEVRDDPTLKGKPLIIGSLPNERGVVATCSYEARKFGIHSAMNIKEAYRLCPDGVYMHPNFKKTGPYPISSTASGMIMPPRRSILPWMKPIWMLRTLPKQ